MTKYSEPFLKARVLLALDGFNAPSMGARFIFWRESQGDGRPFTKAMEVIEGYWMIQVKS